MDLFKNYSWPGNIRELKSVLEHGICFAKGEYINLQDLPKYLFEKSDNERDKSFTPQLNYYNFKLDNKSTDLEDLRLDFERAVIKELIDKYGDTVEGKK